LSQEKVLKTLQRLGLAQSDAQVYVFLGKRGSQKAKEICQALKLPKQQVYLTLKSLQGMGIVNSTLEHPARFSAVSFEKLLDLFVKAKIEEAQRIEQGKAESLSDWHSITIEEPSVSSPKFTVLEGRNYIYSKIKQMVEQTTNQFSVISPVSGLIRGEQFGLIDLVFSRESKSKIQFKFLTELSELNLDLLKDFLEKTRRAGFKFEGREPELGLKLFTRIVIRDDEEAIFFVTPNAEGFEEKKHDICLWTNCRSLVNSFSAVFEELWHNSKNIEKRIAEIETGSLSPNIEIINDAKTAHRRFFDAMRYAKAEIVMMTSSNGLLACWKNKDSLNEWTRKGIFVRIMAPITNENLEAAQQLLKICEVRHIPAGYLGTTIVDGTHLFQFKNPPSEDDLLETIPYFENTFYTNDSEYIEKTKKMLNVIWENAQAPSATTLQSTAYQSLLQSPLSSDDPLLKTIKKMYATKLISEDKKNGKNLTEKEVIAKILKAQKHKIADGQKEAATTFSTNAQAIVHPPDYLNLPDLLFHIYHMDKQSTYGTEDAIQIQLWTNTPIGESFVPVAVITDNPDAVNFWKKICAGTPASQNIQLLDRDEIEIRFHGTTCFAGWTKPIQLVSSSILPPSCLLIEGYGKVKTLTYEIVIPSGYSLKNEGNTLDAFVTFLHPSSKYSGPGTDGCIARDVTIEWNPT
jgi:HTH-type transcriptional regulator, sugar sensing transcriptional regulator